MNRLGVFPSGEPVASFSSSGSVLIQARAASSRAGGGGGREGRREGEDGEGGGAGHICGWLVVHGRLRHVVQKG